MMTDTTKDVSREREELVAELVAALRHALKLLEPFDDPELSLGLGHNALAPIRAALSAAEAASVPTDEMVERVAKAVEPELDRAEMVLADPLTLKRLKAQRIARAALAAMPGWVDVKPLDWQETYVDRGDGSKEVSGWKADNGFNQWYSVEMYFGTDSYGWQVKFDGDVIADHDDPERAKAAAQKHFASRILSRLKTSGAIGEEGCRLVPEVDYSPALEAKAMMVLEMGEELIKAALSSLPTPPTAQEGK